MNMICFHRAGGSSRFATRTISGRSRGAGVLGMGDGNTSVRKEGVGAGEPVHPTPSTAMNRTRFLRRVIRQL
jgi:hypothetical protein